MAERSSHEQTIVDWFHQERVILNSREILESKQEIDIYFPKYKIGVEINGAMWHSEAVGKTKYAHQEKYKSANKSNIALLSFYDWEIKDKPELIKSLIQREMLKSYSIQYSMTKRYVASEDELEKFLTDHALYSVNDGTSCFCRSDKKGLCSVLGVLEKPTHFRADFYIERKGVHVINGIAKECEAIRSNLDKPLIITLGADHGFLYPRSLTDNGYKVVDLSDPTFYYLQGSKVLPSTTSENTEGYTRVFDSGKLIFCHKDDYEYISKLEKF